MRIAVVGAGPAGLTSAKQALAGGHEVVVYERSGDLGGIWNPASGGAYEGVRMQSSRMSFPFSDFPPEVDDDFLSLVQVQDYLRAYARRFAVLPLIRFGHPVTAVARLPGGGWEVTARHTTDRFDAVLVANGELWRPRMPGNLPPAGAGVRVLSAKDYRRPDQLRGQRVLVVGGGVSGADIASEAVGVAAGVEWSVRRRALFLPRAWGGVYNDALFSYAGRVAVEELPYDRYLSWLDSVLPEYMAAYRSTGLLPSDGFHHAVHVNEKIIPLVARGAVVARPAFDRFTGDGSVSFVDGSRRRYDTVVLCLGYQMPDYRFLAGFRREDLYEHHFWRHDPTLAVINTPVDTEAFGTACPYFETIAGWVLATLSGKVELPGAATMAGWCAEHMSRLTDRRHLDCWLETIRIGLASGSLPDPNTAFREYWALVSSIVDPANLRPSGVRHQPARYDDLVDLAGVRLRILAALPAAVRDELLAAGEVGVADHAAAAEVPPSRRIAPWLPYRQRR